MIPTRDHKEIRRWAAKHDAMPAESTPITFDSEPTMLHFLMGAAKEGTPELHPISWESFFAKFDLLGLALAYDEGTPRFDLVRIEPAQRAVALN